MPEPSSSRYFSQLRQTHQGHSLGWQNCCDGHLDIYQAMGCHDSLKLGLENPTAPGASSLGTMLQKLNAIAPDMTFELRVVKMTMTTEVMEEAILCAVKTT